MPVKHAESWEDEGELTVTLRSGEHVIVFEEIDFVSLQLVWNLKKNEGGAGYSGETSVSWFGHTAAAAMAATSGMLNAVESDNLTVALEGALRVFPDKTLEAIHGALRRVITSRQEVTDAGAQGDVGPDAGSGEGEPGTWSAPPDEGGQEDPPEAR